jgi:hypothetical protein
MNCSRCDREIVTGTELMLLRCSDCLSGLVKQSELDQAELTKLRSQTTELDSQVNRIRQLMAAEEQGREAARRSMNELDNPHKEDSELGAMWEHGRLTSSLQLDVGRQSAVKLWAVGVLEHVIELARGYKQEEIAVKLDTVVQKLLVGEKT